MSAPISVRPRAIALPSPRLPPVTRATLPVRLKGVLLTVRQLLSEGSRGRHPHSIGITARASAARGPAAPSDLPCTRAVHKSAEKNTIPGARRMPPLAEGITMATTQETGNSAPTRPLSQRWTAALAVIAGLIRLVPHPWNFTPVGAVGLFSGGRLRGRRAFAVPLGLIAFTDLVLWALRGPDYSPLHVSRLFVYP